MPTALIHLGENKMRLTKRQLKRIIREEYSRLKRRGLIREMGEVEHEQDEFLAEQIGQYEGEICQTITQCAMKGYMEQESNPDSDSPESALANSCMFYGQETMYGQPMDKEILTIAMKCGPFRSLIQSLKDEQKSMFGASARNIDMFELIVDMGIVEMCCEEFQSEVGGY